MSASGPEVSELVLRGFQCWKQMTSSVQRLLSCDYALSDVLTDVDACLSTSSACAAGLAERWFGGAPRHSARPSATWSATMKVLPSVTRRPLTLRSDGLRAVGQGNAIAIPSSAVTFEPSVVETGHDTFTVRVSFGAGVAPSTLIYEGDITAKETNAPVSDKVRANNRDGGPVQ